MKRRHSLPAEIYSLVEHSPGAVLLEGGPPHASHGNEPPWTQLFLSPARICVAHRAEEIPALLAAIDDAIAAGEFAAGFFAYECAAAFEAKAGVSTLQPNEPLAWFGIYSQRYVFDHSTGNFVGGEPSQLAGFREIAQSAGGGSSLKPRREIAAEFSLDETEYARHIAAIHEYIRAGDVYQLNFTAPFQIKLQGSVADHYAQLRGRQPAAYGAFLHWSNGRHILSFSPELFFRVDEQDGKRLITTRPMKGTAARGRTSLEDRTIAEWLQNDPKNRSENLMIVDLLRNDLGRIAEFGSVRAQNLFAVERHPTLWQMTSTITADLRFEIRNHDIFRALFPCGSVTGAPKIRAMQLLTQLEENPRGIYTGAIGFFSTTQTVFNVAIRTLELEGGEGTFGAGSGIVIDSEPAQEYRECLLKASFLTNPAQRAADPSIPVQHDSLCLIESLLWNGTYPLLELHLDRLADSADYFGFACDRDAVRFALEIHASQFADTAPRKVRLLLSNIDMGIGSELLPADPNPQSIARVRMASKRTDPTDPTLYHKTTQRAIYAQELLPAQQDGYDDVLFMNQRGEVTEGAISNVFIEKNGVWFTPPVSSGLLAGVYRRHLLETRPEMAERVLNLTDLQTADAVYISNAVRGLRRVEVDF